MKDFYKKLLSMSIQDAQELSREHDTEAVDEMAMQLYQTRVRHWHMKSMEEKRLNLPDDPTGMYD